MNQIELARERAKAAKLYARLTVHPLQYTVRSRSRGYDHVVSLLDNQVVNCSGCQGFFHRGVCIHMGAVLNRLARLSKHGRRPSRVAVSRWEDPLAV